MVPSRDVAAGGDVPGSGRSPAGRAADGSMSGRTPAGRAADGSMSGRTPAGHAADRRREARDAAWLALIPFGVALVLGLLLAPRKPAPEAVPLPVADARALVATREADERLAAAARATPLPGAVRALGSAIRAFHALEARGAAPALLGKARGDVDAALV